ncbi:Meiotically up-regulated protein [Lasiodiplodia theobromae]|uniref:Meiotically up-regulated protein n=1 Tax=Lasiodiplodia theobromae TaxID=45133 RepID=UPI0015C3C444|nr:Meiotically up-regulated protein [Lasiodiplodia theobromae]KAF4538204.1 Meiotically up-regulated protein [Lasiodiplodia theobromae]
MFDTLSGEEEGDEDEEYRDPDSEDEEQEGTDSPLKHLWPFIHALLCNDHRHWFWLKFYYDEWQRHVAREDSAVGDSEYWSDSESGTVTADAGRNDWSDSESASEAEDFSGGYATPRAEPCSPSPEENEDEVEEDLVASMRKRDADASSSDSSDSDSNSAANATILTPGWSRSISEKLHDGILQSLGRKTSSGCIYIMRTPAHPGLIKIGKAKDPTKRRNEIERDCNLDDLRVLHVWRDVPHHERAELLIGR